MTSMLPAAVAGFAAAVGLLTAFILGARTVAALRRSREAKLRPPFELALAEYVVEPDAPPPELPLDRGGRSVFRAVALEALTELRGRERERLTLLLEQTGVVRETAAELQDRRRLARRRAADALAQMGSAEATEALLAGLADPDRDVRLACARALAELGDERHLPAVLSEAEEAVEERTGAVAELLLALGARATPALAQLFAATGSQELRRLIVSVLGELRLADYAPLLREALADPDDELAARAARGVGLIGDVDAAGALLTALGDGRRAWFVRAAAARALGAIGAAQAVRALEWALRSEAWWVQANAAQALALLGEEGREALGRALSSHRPSARALAKAALEP